MLPELPSAPRPKPCLGGERGENGWVGGVQKVIIGNSSSFTFNEDFVCFDTFTHFV